MPLSKAFPFSIYGKPQQTRVRNGFLSAIYKNPNAIGLRSGFAFLFSRILKITADHGESGEEPLGVLFRSGKHIRPDIGNVHPFQLGDFLRVGADTAPVAALQS